MILKDKIKVLENLLAAKLNVVITLVVAKVLTFSLILIQRYKAVITTDELSSLRELSRETDKLLKSQIVIRSKLENPNQDKSTKEISKDLGVPVKRKFENESEKPTNIPA